MDSFYGVNPENPELLKWLKGLFALLLSILLLFVFILIQMDTLSINFDTAQIDRLKVDVVLNLPRYKEESIGIDDIMDDQEKTIRAIQNAFGLDELQADNAAEYLYVLEMDDSSVFEVELNDKQRNALINKLEMLERTRFPFFVWMFFVHPFFAFFIPLWLALISLCFCETKKKFGLLTLSAVLLDISGLFLLSNIYDFNSLDVRYSDLVQKNDTEDIQPENVQ